MSDEPRTLGLVHRHEALLVALVYRVRFRAQGFRERCSPRLTVESGDVSKQKWNLSLLWATVDFGFRNVRCSSAPFREWGKVRVLNFE